MFNGQHRFVECTKPCRNGSLSGHLFLVTVSNTEFPGDEKHDRIINISTYVETCMESNLPFAQIYCGLVDIAVPRHELARVGNGVIPWVHRQEIFEKVCCLSCVNSKCEIVGVL